MGSSLLDKGAAPGYAADDVPAGLRRDALDGHPTWRASSDPSRQAFLDHLAVLADRIGARVVAEGIEQPADLARVRGAGSGLLQAYLLGRSAPAQTWTTLLCA
jgi:EAL domain-containing protein (putative c-di-GMP-specific phosphodiesterase class I)